MPSRASNGSITRLLSGESNRQVAFLISSYFSLLVVLTETQRLPGTHLFLGCVLGSGEENGCNLERGTACGGYNSGPESQSLRDP